MKVVRPEEARVEHALEVEPPRLVELPANRAATHAPSASAQVASEEPRRYRLSREAEAHFGLSYGSLQTLSPGQNVALLFDPNVSIAVADLLP